MIDIGIIVSGVGLARSIGELMGLVETLGAKIDKLSQSELAAALRNLDQACSSKVEAVSLVREARNCFNKAIGLESGYRRGVAYLGLALCHSHLDDRENSVKALRELLHLAPAPSLSAELIAKAASEQKGKGLFETFVKEVFTHGNVRRLATVITRRAKQTPDSIRRFVQPTRDELIFGVRADADAGSLARLQILVAVHLDSTVNWMEKHEISAEDLDL